MKQVMAIILSLLLPMSSWAAIGFVQHQTATTAAVTVTVTGTGNVGLVFCFCNTGRCTSVSDNAGGGTSTYTEVPASRGANTTSGTNAFTSPLKSGVTTVTCAGTSPSDASFFEYSGANTASPVDVATGTVNGTGAGTDTGNSLTTTNTGDVIASYIAAVGSATGVFAPYGHFLENGDGVGSADYTPGVTVTSSATWTGSPGNFANSAVAILPATGGATCPSVLGSNVICGQGVQ